MTRKVSYKLCRQATKSEAAGCSQLQSIILTNCRHVTDAGISALGVGCGQLRSIDLMCCRQATDIGIFALTAGCSQLRKINFAGCNKVTEFILLT